MVWQPQRGFRYGAEAFWLVGFALEGGGSVRAADLGTGSGIAALLLAARGVEAVGIDARPEWGPLWERTLAESAVGGRAALRQGDVRDGIGGPYDLVVSNPPYFRAGSGPVAPSAWKAAARTESSATLADFVRAGIEALAEGGRMCLVLPVDRENDALAAATERGFTARRRVRVGQRRLLLELRPGLVPAQVEVVSERDPRVLGWYAIATGSPPTG